MRVQRWPERIVSAVVAPILIAGMACLVAVAMAGAAAWAPIYFLTARNPFTDDKGDS